MKRNRLITAASTICLIGAIAAPAFANDYNPRASAQAAQTWGQDASALAPQVSPAAAESWNGPTLVASQPVPDTPTNRTRFGGPMSRAGRMTAPIGD